MKSLIQSQQKGERKQKRKQWKRRPQDFGIEMQKVVTREKSNGHISEMVQTFVEQVSILHIPAAFLGT